jgi:hypothetical protein
MPNLISIFWCLGCARESIHFQGPCTYFTTNIMFYGGGVVSPLTNPQAEGPPSVSCPPLLIQYIRSYPPYLEAVSSIHNLRTCHVVVTRDPLNMVCCDKEHLNMMATWHGKDRKQFYNALFICDL